MPLAGCVAEVAKDGAEGPGTECRRDDRPTGQRSDLPYGRVVGVRTSTINPHLVHSSDDLLAETGQAVEGGLPVGRGDDPGAAAGVDQGHQPHAAGVQPLEIRQVVLEGVTVLLRRPGRPRTRPSARASKTSWEVRQTEMSPENVSSSLSRPSRSRDANSNLRPSGRREDITSETSSPMPAYPPSRAGSPGGPGRRAACRPRGRWRYRSAGRRSGWP